MSRRTLSVLLVAVALVTVVGVTTALAGSANRGQAPSTKSARTSVPKAHASATGGVVQSPTQSADAGSYWTPERMNSATPREMTVPGGSSAPSHASPAVKPGGTASTGGRARTARTKASSTQKRKTNRSTKQSQGTAQTSGVTVHQSTSDAASYWTPERMANATPKDSTVPGGNGSQGTGGSGGIRAAPTP